jgi:hypothetical protein
MFPKANTSGNASQHDETQLSASERAVIASSESESPPARTIDLKNPHRPLTYRLVRSLKKPRKIDLNKLKYAEYLDSTTRENGEFLLNCFHETAHLNGFGQVILEQFVNEVLLNNYQINRQLRERTFPAIKAPTFILGMPRTGSTYLFNLLGATRHFRTLRSWETHKVASKRPVPVKKMESHLQIKLLHHFAPGMRTIHEQRVEGPEECSKMLLSRFVSQMFPTMFHLPAYNEFLETADYLPTYVFYKQQLQLLGDHGKPWMLKSPIHTQSLDSILKVFPDAKFIHLQRDFNEVLGSICSLTAAFRSLTSDRLDGREIGREVKKFLTRDNTRADAILNTHRERVLPIPYRDFLSAPLETVSSIFRFVGAELYYGQRTRIKKEMHISVPNKFGKHNSRLTDYF